MQLRTRALVCKTLFVLWEFVENMDAIFFSLSLGARLNASVLAEHIIAYTDVRGCILRGISEQKAIGGKEGGTGRTTVGCW